MRKETVEITVARLDERQNALKSVVDEIKDNHLVHIAADIKELRTGQEKTDNRLAYWGGGGAAILLILQLFSLYLSMKNGPQQSMTSSVPQTTSQSAIISLSTSTSNK